MLLKVRLNNVRAITVHALHSVAEHRKTLEDPTRALDEVLTGTRWGRWRTCSRACRWPARTVDETPKGRLVDVPDTLREVLSRAGEQAGEGEGASPALPEGHSTSAGGAPSEASRKEK